jgi:hypothetical protein
MGKRKRPGGRRSKQSTVQELTFDGTDNESSSALLETQSFTFLASGSGQKARTTHVQGRRGLPDRTESGHSADPVSIIADATQEDTHSGYGDSDFFTAFDATEMHFEADDGHELEELGDQGDESEEAKERTREILAGVSHLFICFRGSDRWYSATNLSKTGWTNSQQYSTNSCDWKGAENMEASARVGHKDA